MGHPREVVAVGDAKRAGKVKTSQEWWDESILLLGTKELNRFLKTGRYTSTQIAALKTARRRAKNRTYAVRSRQKKSTQENELEVEQVYAMFERTKEQAAELESRVEKSVAAAEEAAAGAGIWMIAAAAALAQERQINRCRDRDDIQKRHISDANSANTAATL